MSFHFFTFSGALHPQLFLLFYFALGTAIWEGPDGISAPEKNVGVFLALCQRFGRGLTAARVRKMFRGVFAARQAPQAHSARKIVALLIGRLSGK